MTLFKTIFFLFLCSFWACSFGAEKTRLVIPEIREHKVTAYSGDKEVKDLEQQFVHYIEVSQDTFPIEVDDLAYDFILVNDKEGEIRGLKTHSRSSLSSDTTPGSIGLRAGDVLTAVGKIPVTSLQEIKLLLETIKVKGEASAIIERGGYSHKLFYLSRN